VNDWDKSKAQLIEELAALRAEVAIFKRASGVTSHGQSVSVAQADELLLAGNSASVPGQDLSPASLKPAAVSAPRAFPVTLRHWLTALFPITNDAGQVVAIGGSVREVTEFRQLLERLQEHEFSWQTAQRIAHVGSWQFDYTTNTVFWSEGVYRIHGYDPTLPPPQGEALEQSIHPDDREHHRQVIGQARAGESFEMELRIIRPNGEIRYVEARGEPGIFDDQGQLIRIFGTLLDITERKQAEIALRRSEFALREAQRIAHVGHWSWDKATKEISWSDEIFRIHGLDPGDPAMVLDDIAHFIHPDDTATRGAIFAAALKGESSEADLRIVRPSGEVRHIEARCSPRAFNEQGSRP
jgi:PAS domain S-box-containing protein